MPPRTARRCPHCDAAIDPSATFCDQCGNTLPATGSTQILPKPSARRSSPLLWVVTIAVIGVVIGLVGVVWSRVSQPTTVVMLVTSSVPSVVPATAARITSTCLVPNVVGQDQGAAEGLIAGAGLQPVKSTAYDISIPVGGVIAQDPPSGTEMASCQGKVTIIVSLGSVPQPTIPPPTDTPPPPTTCRDILTQNPSANDGEYTVYVNQQPNKPFTVYCYNMQTDPTEYLSLAYTGSNYNFSRYAAGGARLGEDVVSVFTKVRIDPFTLKVETTDLTFANTTGFVSWDGGQITSWRYANAGSCVAQHDRSGTANINLRGTPFAIDDSVSFNLIGSVPNGSTTFTYNRQVVDLTGGGHCGENSVSVEPPKKEFLQLKYLPNSVRKP